MGCYLPFGVFILLIATVSELLPPFPYIGDCNRKAPSPAQSASQLSSTPHHTEKGPLLTQLAGVRGGATPAWKLPAPISGFCRARAPSATTWPLCRARGFVLEPGTAEGE